MKKLTVAATLLVSTSLLLAGTLPADAASTRAIAVTDVSGPVAVDVASGRVYVGTTPTPPPTTDPVVEWNSSGGVAQVDVRSKRVIKSVTLFTLQSSAIGAGVSDVEVNPLSPDLWVLVGQVTTGFGCSAELYQLDKKSLATVRTFELGCTRKVEVDPTSRTVFLTEAPFYDDRGDDAQPVTKGTIVKINGANGDLKRVDVPSPTTGVSNVTEGYFATSIAFNLRDRQVDVVGQGRIWRYSTALKLRGTTTLDYPTDSSLQATVDPLTDRLYVTDGSTLTELADRTGVVRRAAVLTGRSLVLDVGANLLYLGSHDGSTVVNLKTLLPVRQETRAVSAVDPLTHARYSVTTGLLHLDR